MIWIYAAAAIFGCAFLIPMVLGGLDSDVGDGFGELGDGVDLDVDLDVEVDADIGGVDGPEADFDGVDGGPDGPLGAIFNGLLSFRTLVFFSAFFGTSGIVFGLLGYSPVATAATAVLIGLIAAVVNSALFSLVRNSQANSQIDDRTLEGRPARVVLPIEGAARGRIRIDLTGQPHYLVARALEDRGERFEVGAPVVVVAIENGTALVASLAELDAEEELGDGRGADPAIGPGSEHTSEQATEQGEES